MKNKITYLPIGILTLTTALSGVALSSAGAVAELSGSKTATVTVGTACTFTGTTTYSADMSVYAGTVTESNTTRDPYTISCNSPTGFKVQAVGFSPDATHPAGLEGNTSMYGDEGSITTGTSGPGSYWAFKIGFSYASMGTATVLGNYADYSEVPSVATNVINYTGSTSAFVTGLFRPDYKVYAATNQSAGTYSGAVKYTVVPNS